MEEACGQHCEESGKENLYALAVKERRMEYPSYKKALQAVTDAAVVVPPPLTAGYQRFDKQTLIDRHRSRF